MPLKPLVESGRLAPPRLRVVVVDDSVVALRSICSVVEDLLGFEIVGTETGGTAGLALAVTLQPDLVLLDLWMPDLGGTEIAEILSRQFPAMKVIIVSLYDTAETQRLARLAGAHGFVSKRRLATDLPWVAARALAEGEEGNR